MFELLGCPIAVEPHHMSAIVLTESSAYPYAIGVVGHRLSRQPNNLDEAISLVKKLKTNGINYSVGLAQVNQVNFAKYGLTESNMFDACKNITTGSQILKACYKIHKDWNKAYSCYYSGNPTTGFRHGYVGKVRNNLGKSLTGVRGARNSNIELKVYERKKTRGVVVSKVDTEPSLVSRRLSSRLNGKNKGLVPSKTVLTLAQNRLNSQLNDD